jgi:hypothetical protein
VLCRIEQELPYAVEPFLQDERRMDNQVMATSLNDLGEKVGMFLAAKNQVLIAERNVARLRSRIDIELLLDMLRVRHYLLLRFRLLGSVQDDSLVHRARAG